jgi:hypothetical protein
MQSNSPLIERMMRAARLDVNLYEEVEADLTATGQAATVVGIVAVCGGIGGGLAQAIAGRPGAAVGIFVFQILMAYVVWVAWSYITFWVGTSIFKGTATPGEMLRTIGFAQTPGILNIVAFIPILGGIIGFVAGIWALIAAIIAIRQALDITTGQAVITAIIGAIPLFLLLCMAATILGILGGVAS